MNALFYLNYIKLRLRNIKFSLFILYKEKVYKLKNIYY